MSTVLTPEQYDTAERKLRTEILKRRAKNDLVAFTEFTYPKYRTSNIHKLIGEQLDRVRRGEIDRLGLLVPPRHGKSELASRRFPAHYLGHYPDRFFISASASAQLATDFGREVKNIMNSPEYGQVFDTRLATDSQAKGSWHTDKGGQYYAVGIGTDVMGRGAHVLLIDDPFGSMADARSDVGRKTVWDWYSGTAYNRLEDNSAIVVINHRMHEDDLTGMIREQEAAGGDKFEWVELKAIETDAKGVETALWPEKYPLSRLHRIRANTKAADWSSLYQQNPTPDDGIYFQADWLKAYTPEMLPDRRTMRVYGASDYAVTDNGGDYTVHIVVGIDPDEKMWLLDLWRAQTNSLQWVEAFCDLVLEWHPLGWAEETGQIKSGVGPFRDKRQRERKAFVAKKTFPTKGDKAVRSTSIRGRMELNGLYVPTGAPWYPEFRSELLAFNSGKHDDQVDALGLLGQILDVMIAGHALPEEKEEKIISTDPTVNNVTLHDLFASNERKRIRGTGRIL